MIDRREPPLSTADLAPGRGLKATSTVVGRYAIGSVEIASSHRWLRAGRSGASRSDAAMVGGELAPRRGCRVRHEWDHGSADGIRPTLYSQSPGRGTMPHPTLNVGSITIISLSDGSGSRAPGDLMPSVPAEAWAGLDEYLDANGHLQTNYGSFLIHE